MDPTTVVAARACSSPLVSIQIAAYDRLDPLRESVASALSQRWQPLEVLVIDDGSAEETRDWLNDGEHRDARLRVIRQPHAGVARARQTGLEATTAEFVCVLDSDDVLAYGAVERIMALFREAPDLDLVYTNNLHLHPDGDSSLRRYPRFRSNRAMLLATFLHPIVPFKHSGTTYRRSVAIELGGYDCTLPIKVDVDLFLRFLDARRQLRLLEEPLVHFRLHAASMSHRHRWEGARAWAQLVDRYWVDRPAWERVCLKAVRGSLEMAKMVYALVQLR